jgi:hypothetical protein
MIMSIRLAFWDMGSSLAFSWSRGILKGTKSVCLDLGAAK